MAIILNQLAGAGPGSAQIGNPVFGFGSGLAALQQEGTGITFFAHLISTLVGLFLIAGSIFFVFMFLAGAVAWISSGGDKGQVENARNRITHALIGLVILFSVFAIVKVIEGIFGTSILSLDIGPLKL